MNPIYRESSKKTPHTHRHTRTHSPTIDYFYQKKKKYFAEIAVLMTWCRRTVLYRTVFSSFHSLHLSIIRKEFVKRGKPNEILHFETLYRTSIASCCQAPTPIFFYSVSFLAHVNSKRRREHSKPNEKKCQIHINVP